MASFLALMEVLLLACQAQAAVVFAHFMVANAENYTDADWHTDIGHAQTAHIDAFAMNMAYNEHATQDVLSAAFSASDSLGFKLFFSFDYAGNGNWPEDDVISLINQYKDRSSYYYYKDQPFVSKFEGPSRVEDWVFIKASTGSFFIPDWSSLGAGPAITTGVTDGLFSWAGWPWGPRDMDTYVDASYLDEEWPYMMPMWRGDDLWHDHWPEVLFLKPDFVQIISWNDYGESHYISPLTAEVTEEKIVAWYRLSAAAACASGGTSGNTASQLQLELPPTEIAQDKIFYSAVLGSFSEVVVSIGGDKHTATWTVVPDDNVGAYHGSVDFDGRTGPVTVGLVRNEQTIAKIDGEAIGNCAHDIQNWNAWVGSATGPSVSAKPLLPLSKQVCITGKDVDNFSGLCEFRIQYGYCPRGACTCTKMGAGNEKPESTGVFGYPLEGEGASYSGLCTFNCNLGSCPPTACGTVEYPLVNPTVSPFLPPTCINGTGEGNLEGLCNFGCAHGFCPINACTCNLETVLNLFPPTSDDIAVAAPGLDNAIYQPLCQYAIQNFNNFCVNLAQSIINSGTIAEAKAARIVEVFGSSDEENPSLSSDFSLANGLLTVVSGLGGLSWVAVPAGFVGIGGALISYGSSSIAYPP
ncbi:glycosyl hydrolase family 71-domain-containing protein [Aspergillus crustosus]